MKTFQKKVDNGTVDYLERLNFELEGTKRIIKELILENREDASVLDGKTFQRYNQKYEERFAAYETAKDKMAKEFIPPAVRESGDLASWDLDFATGILSYSVRDGGKYEDAAGVGA